MFVPLGGLCFLLSLFADDIGLPDAMAAPGGVVADSMDTEVDVPDAILHGEKD